MISAIKENCDSRHYLDVIADVQATLELFQRCQAIVPDDVVPVARDHSLFGLRVQFEAWGLLIRIYETEAPHLPHHLVALRCHQKVTDVPPDEIKVLQNAEIDIATGRWLRGRDEMWGLT